VSTDDRGSRAAWLGNGAELDAASLRLAFGCFPLLRIQALEADPSVEPLVFHASKFARLAS